MSIVAGRVDKAGGAAVPQHLYYLYATVVPLFNIIYSIAVPVG